MSGRAVLALLALVLGLAAPAAAEPAAEPPTEPATEPTRDPIERAEELLDEGRPAQALAVLRAAQEEAPQPRLLLHLARTYERLGQHRAAAAHYEAFLAAAPHVTPALRAEAQRILLVHGRPYQAVRPPRLRPARRPLTALRIAGLALFIAGHAVSSAVGLPMAVQGSVMGGTLLVPVAGPFIHCAMAFAGSPLYGGIYGLPLLGTVGTMQVAGLWMMLAGYTRHRDVLEPVPLDELTLTPFSTPGGGGLALEGRF